MRAAGEFHHRGAGRIGLQILFTTLKEKAVALILASLHSRIVPLHLVIGLTAPHQGHVFGQLFGVAQRQNQLLFALEANQALILALQRTDHARGCVPARVPTQLLELGKELLGCFVTL